MNKSEIAEKVSNCVDLRGINGVRSTMKPVNYYGCVRCQKQHFEDTEPEIYKLHIYWQEKHGIKTFHETLDERKRRYEERFLAKEGKEIL